MNLPPVAILYTQDQEFVRRAKAFLRMMGQVRHVAEPDRLDAVLQQTGPAVLLIDLHAKESRELINQIQSDWPEVLIIAFGAPHSDPLREAEEFGIYAAEDLQLDRNRFQALVGRAFDLLRVMQENRELRDQSTPQSRTGPSTSITFGYDNGTLLQSVFANVALSARISPRR